MNAMLNKTTEVKAETKVDPKVENKPAVKQEQVKTETKVEPKVEAKAEPKILADKSAEIATPTPPKENNEQSNLTAEQKKYANLTVDQLFDMFGGEQKRGVISEVIRTLNSVGFTTSAIAKMVGRRYQHVRNVLTEDARKADEAKRRAAKQAAQTPTTK